MQATPLGYIVSAVNSNLARFYISCYVLIAGDEWIHAFP